MSEEKREFLHLLEEPFQDCAPNCLLEYREAGPFPGPVLDVTIPGREGSVRIVPFSLNHNVKSYGAFPGDGIPHWELFVLDMNGEMGESVLSCRIDRIVQAFASWLQLSTSAPLLESPAPSRDHLRSMAEALAPAPPNGMTGESLGVAATLPPEDRSRFEADVASIAAARIARLFPRSDRGGVDRGECVLLAGYGTEVRGRKPWLQIVAPRKGALAVALEPAIDVNHAHRWDAARWMWDARVPVPSPAERWGIAGDLDRAARCVAFLDDGKFGEALTLYGISWSAEVAQVLAGMPLGMHDASLSARWSDAMRRALWELAPWKLRDVTPTLRGDSARLFTLPGQVHIRKASLMLARASEGPKLQIEYTGTNARLPLVAFTRLLEHDLARLEMAAPELPEEKPARISAHAPKPVDIDKLSERVAEGIRRLERSGYSSALAAAKKLPPEVASELVREAMGERSDATRRRACELAAALQLGECAEAAMELLKDRDQHVRWRAADLLRRIRHAPALPVVAELMLTSHDDYYAGASTFRNWGEKPGNAAFREHLVSSDARIRAATCLAMVQYGGKPLIPKLQHMALEDEPLVAAAALHALAVMDPEACAAAEARVQERKDAREVEKERKRWTAYRRV